MDAEMGGEPTETNQDAQVANSNQRTEEPMGKRRINIVVLEDDCKDYTYEVELGATLKEIMWVHNVNHTQAYKMLLKSSMEHPIQGRLCKFWRQ